MPSEHVFIYYYFDHVLNGEPVAHNQNNPIIPAIASQRKFHPQIPIVVIDASLTSDWEAWPSLLNFEVRKIPTIFESHDFCTMMLGKIITIYNLLPELDAEIIHILDADTFRIKPMKPLMGDKTKLCCTGNTGYVYFPKSSKAFELWAGLCALANSSETLRTHVQNLNGEGVQEESIFNYLRHQLPEMTCKIPAYENFRMSLWKDERHKDYDPEMIKLLHHSGVQTPYTKLELMLKIQEVNWFVPGKIVDHFGIAPIASVYDPQSMENLYA